MKNKKNISRKALSSEMEKGNENKNNLPPEGNSNWNSLIERYLDSLSKADSSTNFNYSGGNLRKVIESISQRRLEDLMKIVENKEEYEESEEIFSVKRFDGITGKKCLDGVVNGKPYFEEYTNNQGMPVLRIDYDSDGKIKRLIRFKGNSNNLKTEFYKTKLEYSREKDEESRMVDKDANGKKLYFLK